MNEKKKEKYTKEKFMFPKIYRFKSGLKRVNMKIYFIVCLLSFGVPCILWQVLRY